MESSTAFSQVVFNDVPHTYPPSTHVTCCYTLTVPFQPNTRDWVGIFQVGWSTTRDYHTFVWVRPTLDVVGQEPVRKQVVFQEYYLPKDDSEFYQFCYVDISGQVRGASTPFCFKNPGEQSVDCSLENGLLVITTQEEVEQSAREKDVLIQELGQMREQNAMMKSALMEREQEVDLLKKQSEQREKEKGDSMKELSQTMEQNESLRNTLKEQQQEINLFKKQSEQREKEKGDSMKELSQTMEQNESLRNTLKEQQQEIDHFKKQSEQREKENGDLMNELSQTMEQNESLRNTLKEQQQEINLFKKQSEQREKEKGDSMKELSQTMEQNESLRNTLKEQQQEIDHFKLSNEELVQKVSQLELQQQQNTREQETLSKRLKSMDKSEQTLTHIQDKYDRAVMKINQLKQEREELQGKVEVQSVEIAELRPSVRERQQELYKLQDTIQLLQVDLQSSEKENERISAELHRMHSLTHDLDKTKRENKELRRSLSQQEMQQNMPDDDMKEQYQILLGQLQDAQTQLAHEKQVSNDKQRRAEQAERDLQVAIEQLQNVATSSENTERRSGKISLQLTEAYGIIDEKVGIIEEMEYVFKLENREKEELSRENQNLKRNIERLREEFGDLQAAPPAPAQPSSPSWSPVDLSTTTTQGQQQDTPPESEEFESLYTTTGSDPNPEEETLMCRHCQESFPGITPDELVMHEQCHKVCPFCTLICDTMEQGVFEDHVYSHEL